jgi:HK97 family phage prohead protease
MKKFYETKDLFLTDCKGMIEDVDLKSRTVTGYFSRFNNIDSDGDVLVKGAFDRTISERGAKSLIPHILDHDIHLTLKQLSKPKLYEKTDGGFFESTISDTTNGIDTLKLYRDGVINQHSFGFKILQKEQKSDARYIKEVMLYEVSTVTLGANSDTPFTGFKSMSKPELIERYKLLRKCYESGDYSDEVFPALEAQMIQIEKDLVETLINKSEAETIEPIKEIIQPEAKMRDWKQILELLK